MSIAELKAEVESYRNSLKGKSGICMFTETGPVGMSVIDAIVKTLEAQQNKIKELEQQLDRFKPANL